MRLWHPVVYLRSRVRWNLVPGYYEKIHTSSCALILVSWLCRLLTCRLLFRSGFENTLEFLDGFIVAVSKWSLCHVLVLDHSFCVKLECLSPCCDSHVELLKGLMSAILLFLSLKGKDPWPILQEPKSTFCFPGPCLFWSLSFFLLWQLKNIFTFTFWFPPTGPMVMNLASI